LYCNLNVWWKHTMYSEMAVIAYVKFLWWINSQTKGSLCIALSLTVQHMKWLFSLDCIMGLFFFVTIPLKTMFTVSVSGHFYDSRRGNTTHTQRWISLILVQSCAHVKFELETIWSEEPPCTLHQRWSLISWIIIVCFIKSLSWYW